MRENRIIIGAFGVSLLLHLVLALVTWHIPFMPKVDPALAADRNEVEVFLEEPDQAKTPAKDQDLQPGTPRMITSVPDRLASKEPPVRPDFKGDQNAVAANPVPGVGKTPRADQVGPFNSMEIRQEELTGAGGVHYIQGPLPEASEAKGGAAKGEKGADDKTTDADRHPGPGDWALPGEQKKAGAKTEGDQDAKETDKTKQPELKDWWGGQAPVVTKEGEPAVIGDRGFEFDQEAMSDAGAGVVTVGQFSLNTVQWNYAPWLKDFVNKLQRHWHPPYAYFPLGVISGSTTLRLVIEKDGTLASVEVLEKDGHESLHEASVAAVRSFAPYTPLPPDFPLPELVLTGTLVYPAWRQ